MKIKIFAGEYIFSENGTHVCDEKGFAIKTTEDIEVDVLEEYVERVLIFLGRNQQIKE